MPGKPLTPEQNECVKAHLRELVKRRDDNQSTVARELGVTQPTVSSVLSGRQGAGYYLVERMAQALGLDEREILGRMPGKGPVAPKPGREARALAAELARQHGVHQDAIASVLDETVSEDGERGTVLWWTDRMRWRERELLAPPRPLLPPAQVPDESGEMRIKRKSARR